MYGGTMNLANLVTQAQMAAQAQAAAITAFNQINSNTGPLSGLSQQFSNHNENSPNGGGGASNVIQNLVSSVPGMSTLTIDSTVIKAV